MKYKLPGAKLFFTTRPDNPELSNDKMNSRLEGDKEIQYQDQTWLKVRWFFEPGYKNITHIRIKVRYHVDAMWDDENGEKTYDLEKLRKQQLILNNLNDSNYPSKKVENKTSFKNNALKIHKASDAIEIVGAVPGEIIKVYSTSGALIKSIEVNHNVVRIKLPAKQVYIINSGQTSYKIAF